MLFVRFLEGPVCFLEGPVCFSESSVRFLEGSVRFLEGPVRFLEGPGPSKKRTGPSKKRTESNFFHDFQGDGGPNRIFLLNSLRGGSNLSFQIGLYLKCRIPLKLHSRYSKPIYFILYSFIPGMVSASIFCFIAAFKVYKPSIFCFIAAFKV